jgi:subtilase family serine protease
LLTFAGIASYNGIERTEAFQESAASSGRVFCRSLSGRPRVFQRARQASRKMLPSVVRPRSFRPQLEELEARDLLSGSALPAASSPPAPVPAAAQSTPASTTPAPTGVAQPDVVLQPSSASPNAGGGTVSYTPAQIRQAYGINQVNATGAGQTIAIVDAYYDPTVASDLATFDAQFGLSAPPSFQQVQMNGVTQTDSGWAMETSLDIEWAHAIAPQANLLLVEAPSNSFTDLLSAVSYAAAQPGVVAVSMSWGGSEFQGESSSDSTFTTPSGHIGGSNLPGSVTFIASSGDSGAGTEYPSVSPNVLTVGGTTLTLTGSGTYVSETAWSGSGGGVSQYEGEPSYQLGVQNSGFRTTPDVAYNADPNTGFLVYDSNTLPNGASGGWIDVGGTSAGAPQWAGLVALADQLRAENGEGSLGNLPAAVYTLPASDFHDITSGSNGYPATPGYDLVTGRGSPIANLLVPGLAGTSPTGGDGGGGSSSGGSSSGGSSSTSSTSSTSSSASNSGSFNSSQLGFDALLVVYGLETGDYALLSFGLSDYQNMLHSLSGSTQAQAQNQFLQDANADFFFLGGMV